MKINRNSKKWEWRIDTKKRMGPTPHPYSSYRLRYQSYTTNAETRALDLHFTLALIYLFILTYLRVCVCFCVWIKKRGKEERI